MTRIFNPIDLSLVPPPDVLEPLDFEARYDQLKKMLIAMDPDAGYEQALALESDPLCRLLQLMTYREMLLVARINDATRANMLASAEESDLDAIAARYNIERLVLSPGDPDAVPPVPRAMESDDALRRRIQLAFDGLNTAGSIDSYVFHAMSADGRVRDAHAASPAPTQITLTLLSHEGSGEASASLLTAVRAVFGISPDGTSQTREPTRIRPQGDEVTIQSATIVNYSITAHLVVSSGPAASVIRDAAQAAVETYVNERHRLGADVTHSGIHRALHQPGVDNVVITSPPADIVTTPVQAAWCTGITLTAGLADE